MRRWFLKVCQYIFTISLLSPLGKGHDPTFEQTWFPIDQGCFVPSLVEIGLVILKKKFVNIFLLFRYNLPLKKGGSFICAKFGLNLTLWFLRRRLINFVNVFSLVRYYLLLENGVALHLYKHESHHPRMHCAKFGWIGPVFLTKILKLRHFRYFFISSQ